MPNIGKLFKEEIRRLSRRSLNPFLVPLKKDVAEMKRIIGQQRKSLKKLEQDNARLLADLNSRISRLPEVSKQEAEKTRISPRLIKAQRNRLGLTRPEFGMLLGVSSHTIFLWEHAKTAPRPKIKASLAAVRQLGRRKARERLAAMTALNGEGRNSKPRASAAEKVDKKSTKNPVPAVRNDGH